MLNRSEMMLKQQVLILWNSFTINFVIAKKNELTLGHMGNGWSQDYGQKSS